MTRNLRGRVRFGATGVAALLLLSALSACGSGGDDADNSASPSASGSAANASTSPTALPSPSKAAALPVIGTLKPQGAGNGSKVVVNALRRGSGGLLTLVWTVTNTGKSDVIDVGSGFGGSAYNYVGSGVQGVTLVSAQAKQKYYPLVDDAVHCVCSNFTSVGSTDVRLKPGQSITLYDLYKPDTMPKAVEVDVQGFQPVKNVPVSG